MLLNCTEPVVGRYLVITLPDISGPLNLAEVVVDSEGGFTVFTAVLTPIWVVSTCQ